MKNLHLLAFSCLMACAAQAQTRVPRPLASGVNFSSSAGRMVGVPAKSLNKMARGRDAKAGMRCSARGPLSAATSADSRKRMHAPQQARPLTVQLDTTLCVKQVTEEDGAFKRRTDIAYDKYGLRSLVTQTEQGTFSEISKNGRYTYEVDEAHAFWTRRTLETDYRPSGYEGATQDWYVNDIVERGMDAEGRVTSIKIENPINGWYSNRTFDYAHEYIDYDGRPRRGFEVATEEGDRYTSRHETYRWHEAAGQYLLVSRNSGYNRQEAEFFADSVVTTNYQYDYDAGDWQPYEVTVDYYRVDGHPCEGSRSYYVGQSDGGYGDRSIIIEEGDSVTRLLQIYVGASGQWRNSCKFVEKGTLWESPLCYFKDYYFDEDQQEWYLNEYEIIELVKQMPGVSLYSYRDESGTDGIFMAHFDGEEDYEDVHSLSDDMFVTVSEGDLSGTYTFTYYDMQGNVKAAYRVEGLFFSRAAEPEGATPRPEELIVYVQQADGTWKPMNEFSYTDSQGYTYRHILNAQGLPERIYTYEPGVPDTPRYMDVYTYTSRGFAVDSYEDGKPETRVSFELLDDGWTGRIDYVYNNDNVPQAFSRTDNLGSCTRNYTWDENTQSFILSSVMPGRHTYEEEDGTEVTINYDAEGLDLVPVTMTRTYDPSDEQGWTDFRSSYHWDGDADEWVGDNCSYRSIGYHHFDFTYGHGQPLMSYYDDSYDFDPDDDEVDSSARFLTDLSIAYHWDATAKSFVEDRRYGIVYTPEGDDELSFINYDTTDGSPFTGSYKRDAQGRLVQKTQMVMYPDGRNLPVTYTYTYDPQNYMLTMQEEAGDGVTTLETYTYERRTITVTGIDELRPDATAELTIEGLTLSAPGQRLSLYDLQGAPVTKGTGSVTAPRPGLYIIKVGAASTKVVLR